MKYFLSLLLAISLSFANAQSFESVKDRTGKQLLKGFVSDSILLADTLNFGWFAEHERVYTPAEKITKVFAEKKSDVSFMIFFGTWCTDSHYVIPRFYKIIALSGFDKQRITLFALDRTKTDVAHFSQNFGIAHVPTIIALKNGKEIGRVIEYGTTGRFDEELAAIVAAAN